MGQKIHPFGFRVGITKKHQSVWFARFQKNQYAQTVLEDRFLRQNLSKILLEMFEKKFKNSENMPKISHIQIVRGLIPYEIGIQIHALNCHMMKAAFENFDVQPKILHNLLKNHVLLKKMIGQGKIQAPNVLLAVASDEVIPSQKSEQNVDFLQDSHMEEAGQKLQAKKNFKKNTELQKKAFAGFRKRFLGKFVLLKNKKRISKKFDPNAQNFLVSDGALTSRSERSKQKNLRSFLFLRGKNSQNKKKIQFSGSKYSKTGENTLNKRKAFLEFFQARPMESKSSRSCSKFVNFYMSQTNLSFFNALKYEMHFWNEFLQKSKKSQIQKFGSFRYSPFGSQQKWSLRRFERFEKLSIPVLAKLLKALQQKAFQKMERLRKEYLVFGKFSKTRTFAYFQRIRFLQNFKKYISLRKTNKSLNSFGKNEINSTERQKIAFKIAALNEKALQKKYQNLATEKNTMKFLEYFQNFVQQHRSKNLFLYLATISDARKHLRKIQQFTKQQADFLFGISLKNLENLPVQEQNKILRHQVSKTFFSISQKNFFQNKNFHDVFVEQLQKQRTISQQNIQLIPKISIQFYSVKPQNFLTRASAVADAIVDDLEKRKAFRRVIKKAKEDLMKTPKVKGVKIQVSGRLNGAEIARSEWVRAGRVPLQTLRANIDYCYKTAQTMYGIIGVKVWIYKGFTKMRKPTAKAPSLFSDLL